MLSASGVDEPLRSTSLDVSPGQQVQVSGSIDQWLDADVYSLTSPAAGILTIRMNSQAGGLDPRLEVFSQSGRRIRRNDNLSRASLDSQVRLRVRAGSVVYVRASASRATSGDYTLTAKSRPFDDAGNDIDSARRMSLFGRSRGSLAARINYDGDVDAFIVTANRTGTMRVAMRTLAGQAVDGCLQVFDLQGNLLTSNDDSPGSLDPRVSVDVVRGQRLYLLASSADGSTGRYRLSVAVRRPAPPPPQPRALLVQEDALGADDGPTGEGIAPGDQPVVKLLEADGTRRLRVLGTDAGEDITIAATAEGIRVVVDSQSWDYADIEAVEVYGFGGDDTIRLVDALALPAVIWSGAGDDDVFAANTGGLEVHAGGGDDLLVSLNAVADLLEGGGGLDSFWTDVKDSVTDLSGPERDLGCLHRIESFYQPYSSNPADPRYVPLQPGGQELTDPLALYAYADLSALPLFDDGPQYNDIAQGLLGDCYYLASLAALAQADPQRIEQLIAPLGDGTYAVRLYRRHQEVYLRLDGDLPRYNQYYLSYAQPSPTGEIWVALLEKAYAFFRYGENSYESIEGGWMNDVLPELTDEPVSMRLTRNTTSSALFEYIESALAAGQPVTAGSYYAAGGPVIGGHAYMIQSAEQTADGCYVTLYNPWGEDGVSWDAQPNDGLVRLDIEQVRTSFSRVVVGLA